MSLSDQNYMLKNFWILKVTEKNDLLKTKKSHHFPKPNYNEFLKVTDEKWPSHAQNENFQISSDSKTVSIFGISITLWAKKSPTPFPESSEITDF